MHQQYMYNAFFFSERPIISYISWKLISGFSPHRINKSIAMIHDHPYHKKNREGSGPD